jgi:hypothetical protein
VWKVYLIHSHDSIYIAVEFIALELHIIQNLRGKRDEGYSISAVNTNTIIIVTYTNRVYYVRTWKAMHLVAQNLV